MSYRARRQHLATREVGDELVVYDARDARAHRLNRTTALVWRLCDGSRSRSQLVAIVERELAIPDGTDVVDLALHQLGEAGLLREPLPAGDEAPAISRRRAIALGLVGAMALLLPSCESASLPTAPPSKALRDLGTAGGDSTPPPPPRTECEDVTFPPEPPNPGRPVLGKCALKMDDARRSLDEQVRKFCDGNEACADRRCTAPRRKCRLRNDAEHEPRLVGNILKVKCAGPDDPKDSFFLVGFVRSCPCQCVKEE